MTETQPELLDRWLRDHLVGAGAPPPAGIDPDLVYAVDALRPDRVPVPAFDLDALLQQVVEGPFARRSAAEDAAAAALARYLDGEAEAEDLDPTALEATDALQPERVPV